MTGTKPRPDATGARLPEPPEAAEPAGLVAELDTILSEGLSEAVYASDAYGGVVYLRSHDGRSLVLAKIAGLAVSLLDPWRRISVTSPLPTAAAYRNGRTVFLADGGETMRRFPQLAIGMPYAFGSANIPLRSGPDILGVLCVLWPATPAEGLSVPRSRRLRAAALRLTDALAGYAVGHDIAYDGPPSPTPLGPAALAPNRVGLFDWNVDTGDFRADDEVCALFGIDPRDFDNRAETLADRVITGGGREFRSAARRAVDTGHILAWRMQVQAVGGARRILEWWGRIPVDHPRATGRHLVGAILDLGTSAAAAEAVERLREGVFSLAPDGRITYANRRLQSMLHVRLDDVLGRTPWEALPWLADPVYEDRYRAAMLSQQPGSFLTTTPHGDRLEFTLYPDPYGLTGTVAPADPDAPGPHPAVVPRPPSTAAPPRLGAIYHVLAMAGALTEAVSVSEVCDVVTDQMLPAFGGQELAIYIVRDQRFHLARQAGYPDGFLDPFEGVALDSRLPGVDALTRGTPIFMESLAELVAAYPDVLTDEMSSWAFLPLIASDRPVGTCILGFRDPHVFTPEERSVLTALSGLIAQALERARLYDAEFTLARGLQHALLPHRLPALPNLDIAARYLPGTQGMEIGGDWYDVIETGSTVALVIGDVEGHSVAAAATMGQLRSAVRAFTTGGQTPGGVAWHTNRLLNDLDPGLTASCCYIRLDPHTGRGDIVRAGHPPPIRAGPDGTSTAIETPGGVLLGVDRDTVYPVTPFRLDPHDLLLLYTDGLVEEPGTDIDDGIAQLRRSLHTTPAGTPTEIADRLLHDAGRLTRRADDVALLVARWTPGKKPAGHPEGPGRPPVPEEGTP